MSVNLRQNASGGAGLQGKDLDAGGFVVLTFPYSASSVDQSFFVANRAYVVTDINVRPTVAGTDAGAVTVAVKKAASGTAVSAGTALHSSTANLKGSIHTNQVLTLSTTASDLEIPAGTAIGADFTGVMTSAVGSITVVLVPA